MTKNEDNKNQTIFVYSSEEFNQELYKACSEGRKDLVLLMIEKGANEFDLGLWNACEGGHKELVLLMIEKGAINFNWGLIGACKGGQKELALLMIEYGADDFNIGLWWARKGGHKDIALLMIEKGADDGLGHSMILTKDDCIDLYHRGVNSYKRHNFPKIISQYIKKRKYLLSKYEQWTGYLLDKFI